MPPADSIPPRKEEGPLPVPANRSRTLHWRRCLDQIHERNGAIEIAIDRDFDERNPSSHLLWRVRVLAVKESEIILEQPCALGELIPLRAGIAIIAVMSIGQNRWLFRTKHLGLTPFQLNATRAVPAVRLAMPDSVERCQRRNYYRVGTAALNLPKVEIWPLLDPRSVVLAERANELQVECDQNSAPNHSPDDRQLLTRTDLLPEVGPKFEARLVNLGGGGMGLSAAPEHGQLLMRHKLFWMRFSLPPELPSCFCASMKLVHVHAQSDQSLYVGLSFDFTFNAAHQKFLVDQICRYIAIQQRAMLQRQIVEEKRESA